MPLENMQVVIPMSGFGERFRRAGYTVPKPLIEVEGKPIIAHVIDMFPGVTDITFICNRDHLDIAKFQLAETLAKYCPRGNIVAIDPHKLGPVHAVLQVVEKLDLDRPTVVNYCDFTCYWDFGHFCDFVEASDCDGAVPSYTGFHPHMLGSTNYAYVKQRGRWVQDIQEKQPYTDAPQDEYASSGTYYFKTGAIMQRYFQRTIDEDLAVNGEYYVSLVYKAMLADGLNIAVYELQHFMQWGTPDDVAEYRMWSDAFRRLVEPAYASPLKYRGSTLIPMAGLGERFTKEGYHVPKPLIPVSGKPMVIQATGDLPGSDRHIFVLRRDMPGLNSIEQALLAAYPDARTVVLDGPTDGQARTALLGWRAVSTLAQQSEPLTIAACDNGTLYRPELLQQLLADPETDIIVWVARGYPNASRHPNMYGWVRCNGDRITGVSVKAPLDNPDRDPIITGTFTYRRAEDFQRVVNRMIARGGQTNGEFYLDTCIEDAIALGLVCRIFEIENYLCWGTPDDLRTFEYWQSCFDKWAGHPYRLDQDLRVAPCAVKSLRLAYRPTFPCILSATT